MSYRDDLEAALARIAALEAERGGTVEEWQLERDRVIEEVTQLRAIVEERRITIRDLRARLTELEREHGRAPAAVSLRDHNRGFPPLGGAPAGVTCPQCPDQVMLLDQPRIDLLHATTVVCPRCLFVGRMRTS